MSRPLRVLAMAREIQDSVSQIRLAQPLQYLAQQGHVQLRLRSFYQLRQSDRHWADVAILQRALQPKQLGWLHRLREAGVPVVYEIDDLLTFPAEHLTARSALETARPCLNALLDAATLITASTQPLMEALQAPGRRLYWVPNGGPDFTGPLARHDDTGPISLVVASSDVQRLDSLCLALTTWLAGHTGQNGQAIQVWGVGRVVEVLRAHGLPHQALPMLALDRFLPTLAKLPNPVGLIALDDSAFSRCKSAVKFFDYARAGIPSLCARRLPYTEVVRDGTNGWLCDDTPAAWVKGLHAACNSASTRQQMAAAARQEAQEGHGIDHMADHWRSALQEAIAMGQKGAKPTAPGWFAQPADALQDALAWPQRALREVNRRRLLRRNAASKQG